EDGIRDATVTGVQTCALPISTITRRPPDFQRLNSGSRPQSNVLLQRRSSERSAARNASADQARRPAAAFQGQLNASTDGGTVSLHPHQSETDPVMVRMPGILEECIVVLVTRHASADFPKDVLISII